MHMQLASENLKRFVSELRRAKFNTAAVPAATRHLLYFLGIPGINYQTLVDPALCIIKLDPTIHGWLESFQAGARTESDAALLRALDKPLVHAVLRQTIVRDFEFERLMCAARRAFVSDLIYAGGENVSLELAVSIACQCFHTEYVYATEPAEEKWVESAAAHPAWGQEGTDFAPGIAALEIAVLAMYRPLWTLDLNERLLQISSESWAQPLAPLIAIQVADHLEEAAIREKIPVLGLTGDPVSQAVRQQYEEFPYPRWLSCWIREPRALVRELRSRFPLVDHGPDTAGGTEVLVPGCGTGAHALAEATRYSDARVLAVDLSRASLAYGIRMARRYGITNAEFQQADILALERLGRTFHIVDVYGVLHHMADPAAGLGILASLLKPAGFVRIGVYNRVKRQGVHVTCDFLRERKISTKVEIRGIRREALGLDQPRDPNTVKNCGAFTMSEFRDQFLHAHEVGFTLPELANMIWKAGLRVVGLYDLDAEADAAFRNFFPDLLSMNDMGKLAAFDREYPSPSDGMYQVLAQEGQGKL
jgi:SAM-dependent methyltransferase